MHKIKKATAALRRYLGRDIDGIELLDKVENIANDLRKRLAAETERADLLSAGRLEAEGELIHANSKIRELGSDLAKNQSITHQRERDVALLKERNAKLEKQIDDAMGPNDPIDLATADSVFFGNNLKSCIRSLRGWKHYCPKAMSITSPRGDLEGRKFHVYELTTIVEHLSADELKRLGKFVAVMALMNLPCVVSSARVSTDQPDSDGFLKPFVQWFWKNNMKMGPMHDQYMEQGFRDTYRKSQTELQ